MTASLAEVNDKLRKCEDIVIYRQYLCNVLTVYLYYTDSIFEYWQYI